MPLGFTLKASRSIDQELLRILDSLGTTDDSNPDHISQRRLQWSSFNKAQPRVRVVMLVTKLQLRLFEYFAFEIHHTASLC